MATTVQNVTPTRFYTPFEGMSEAARLTNAVPRGLIRFESTEALVAKAVNDDLQVNITGSLPRNYAYVISSLSYRITVDTFGDFLDTAGFRIFNGIPNVPPGNEQWALFNFIDQQRNPSAGTKTLEFTRGSLREWFPNPLWAPSSAAGGASFTLQIANPADAVQAAGTQFFNCSFYQYDLTQAVRYPLNFPFPVGVR